LRPDRAPARAPERPAAVDRSIAVRRAPAAGTRVAFEPQLGSRKWPR
jgi:hypothetical protein